MPSLELQRVPDCDLDGRISSIRATQPERLRWGKGWLGYDARAIASVDLGSVNKEGVAQVNGARCAGREGYVPVRPHAAQLEVRQPGLSGGGEKARHIGVGADPDARWRVIFANIGEQEQHEQRAVPRRNVHAPVRVVAAGGIASFAGEADVNVPPKITRVSREGEAYDERAHIGAASPALSSDQLVERVIEYGRVGASRNESGRVPCPSLTVPMRTTGRVQVAGSSGSQPIACQILARPSSAISRGNAPSMRTKPSSMNRRT